MLQRIQSLWFLLSIAALSAMFFFPIAELHKQGIVYFFKMSGFFEIKGSQLIKHEPIIILLILNVFISFLSLLNIFLFKNRNLQIKLCLITSLFLIIFSGVILYLTYFVNNYDSVFYKVSSIFPIIAFIFIMLARIGIKSDEKLVRSIDRIR